MKLDERYSPRLIVMEVIPLVYLFLTRKASSFYAHYAS